MEPVDDKFVDDDHSAFPRTCLCGIDMLGVESMFGIRCDTAAMGVAVLNHRPKNSSITNYVLNVTLTERAAIKFRVRTQFQGD
jgi:hypothetical protein